MAGNGKVVIEIEGSWKKLLKEADGIVDGLGESVSDELYNSMAEAFKKLSKIDFDAKLVEVYNRFVKTISNTKDPLKIQGAIQQFEDSAKFFELIEKRASSNGINNVFLGIDEEGLKSFITLSDKVIEKQKELLKYDNRSKDYGKTYDELIGENGKYTLKSLDDVIDFAKYKGKEKTYVSSVTQFFKEKVVGKIDKYQDTINEFGKLVGLLGELENQKFDDNDIRSVEKQMGLNIVRGQIRELYSNSDEASKRLINQYAKENKVKLGIKDKPYDLQKEYSKFAVATMSKINSDIEDITKRAYTLILNEAQKVSESFQDRDKQIETVLERFAKEVAEAFNQLDETFKKKYSTKDISEIKDKLKAAYEKFASNYKGGKLTDDTFNDLKEVIGYYQRFLTLGGTESDMLGFDWFNKNHRTLVTGTSKHLTSTSYGKEIDELSKNIQLLSQVIDQIGTGTGGSGAGIGGGSGDGSGNGSGSGDGSGNGGFGSGVDKESLNEFTTAIVSKLEELKTVVNEIKNNTEQNKSQNTNGIDMNALADSIYETTTNTATIKNNTDNIVEIKRILNDEINTVINTISSNISAIDLTSIDSHLSTISSLLDDISKLNPSLGGQNNIVKSIFGDVIDIILAQMKSNDFLMKNGKTTNERAMYFGENYISDPFFHGTEGSVASYLVREQLEKEGALDKIKYKVHTHPNRKNVQMSFSFFNDGKLEGGDIKSFYSDYLTEGLNIEEQLIAGLDEIQVFLAKKFYDEHEDLLNKEFEHQKKDGTFYINDFSTEFANDEDKLSKYINDSKNADKEKTQSIMFSALKKYGIFNLEDNDYIDMSKIEAIDADIAKIFKDNINKYIENIENDIKDKNKRGKTLDGTIDGTIISSLQRSMRTDGINENSVAAKTIMEEIINGIRRAKGIEYEDFYQSKYAAMIEHLLSQDKYGNIKYSDYTKHYSLKKEDDVKFLHEKYGNQMFNALKQEQDNIKAGIGISPDFDADEFINQIIVTIGDKKIPVKVSPDIDPEDFINQVLTAIGEKEISIKIAPNDESLNELTNMIGSKLSENENLEKLNTILGEIIQKIERKNELFKEEQGIVSKSVGDETGKLDELNDSVNDVVNSSHEISNNSSPTSDTLDEEEKKEQRSLNTLQEKIGYIKELRDQYNFLYGVMKDDGDRTEGAVDRYDRWQDWGYDVGGDDDHKPKSNAEAIKRENDFEELGEAIKAGEQFLEDFTMTYEKVIITMKNGKKVILSSSDDFEDFKDNIKSLKQIADIEFKKDFSSAIDDVYALMDDFETYDSEYVNHQLFPPAVEQLNTEEDIEDALKTLREYKKEFEDVLNGEVFEHLIKGRQDGIKSSIRFIDTLIMSTEGQLDILRRMQQQINEENQQQTDEGHQDNKTDSKPSYLSSLSSSLDEVIEKIKEKNDLFNEEQSIVSTITESEVNDLNKVRDAVNEISEVVERKNDLLNDWQQSPTSHSSSVELNEEKYENDLTTSIESVGEVAGNSALNTPLSPTADTSSKDILDETERLKELSNELEEVERRVGLKTMAFVNEKGEVEKVVNIEKSKLNELKESVESVSNSVNDLAQGLKGVSEYANNTIKLEVTNKDGNHSTSTTATTSSTDGLNNDTILNEQFFNIDDLKEKNKGVAELEKRLGGVLDVVKQIRKGKDGDYVSFRLTGEKGSAWVGANGDFLRLTTKDKTDYTDKKNKDKHDRDIWDKQYYNAIKDNFIMTQKASRKIWDKDYENAMKENYKRDYKKQRDIWDKAYSEAQKENYKFDKIDEAKKRKIWDDDYEKAIKENYLRDYKKQREFWDKIYIDAQKENYQRDNKNRKIWDDDYEKAIKENYLRDLKSNRKIWDDAYNAAYKENRKRDRKIWDKDYNNAYKENYKRDQAIKKEQEKQDTKAKKEQEKKDAQRQKLYAKDAFDQVTAQKKEQEKKEKRLNKMSIDQAKGDAKRRINALETASKLSSSENKYFTDSYYKNLFESQVGQDATATFKDQKDATHWQGALVENEMQKVVDSLHNLINEENKLDEVKRKYDKDNVTYAERLAEQIERVNTARKEFNELNAEEFYEGNKVGISATLSKKYEDQKTKLKDLELDRLSRNNSNNESGNADELLEKRINRIFELTKKFDFYKDKIDRYPEEYQGKILDAIEQLKLFSDTPDIVSDDDLNNIDKLASKLKNVDKIAKESRIEKLAGSITLFMKQNSKMSKETTLEFQGLINQLKKGDILESEIDSITTSFERLKREVRETGESGKSFFDIFRQKLTYITAQQIAMYFSFNDIIRYARTAAQSVINLNTQFTELAKVSDTSIKQLESDFSSYANTAKEIGGTISDTISATADWARMGYNIPDSKELARVALIYKNVGDGIDISSANESLISTLQGFQMEASDAMEIVDKFNEVSNNFAISSSGIGEALQRSAAAFNAANTDLSKSIALVTTSNIVLQDPDSVGTLWKTLSARIRGAKTELEDLGEEEDEFTETTSKLRGLVKSLTGFDIMKDDDTFKDIYEIMIGIGKEWKNLTDVEQASLGEALAGKRNANALYAVLNNIEDLEKAYSTAENSAGSAMREQERFQQSIQYSIDQTKASLEELASTVISSDLLKYLVDVANAFTNIATQITKLGGLAGVLGGSLGFAAGFTNKSLDIFGLGTKRKNKKQIKLGKQGLAQYTHDMQNITDPNAINAIWNNAFENTTGSVRELAEQLKEGTINADQFETALNELGNKAKISTSLFSGFKNILKGIGKGLLVGAISFGIEKLISAIYELATIDDKIAEAANEASSQINNTSKSIDNYKDRINELKEVINDSESSEEQVIQARRDLISVQEEIVKQFKNEAEATDIVTEAINKQTDALDELKSKTYQIAENKFNESSWLETRWLHLNGYKDRLDKMEKDYLSERTEYYRFGQSDNITDDLIQKMRELGAEFKVYERVGNNLRNATESDNLVELIKNADDQINVELTLAGNAEEVYDKVLDLQNLIGNTDGLDDLNDELKDLAATYSKLDEEYADFAKQYVINRKIMSNDEYAESYLDIMSKREAYIDAYSTGDKDKIEQATRDFMQARQDAILKSSADPIVQKFLTNMFRDEMASAIKDVNFKDKLSSNTLFEKLLPYLGEDFKSAYAQYQKDLQDAIEKGIADTEGNIQEVTVGNINTANRQVLSWSERNLKLYKDEVESWGDKIEDYRDSISTVDSRSMEFDDVEITFTPILNTNNGPQYLDQDTMIKYIDSLITSAEQQGLDWKLDANVLLDLDKQGATINGKTINNMLLGTGEVDASLTHLAGINGAVAQSFNYLQESVQSFYSTLSKEDIVNVEALEGYEDKVLDAMDKINLDLAKGTGKTLNKYIGSVANEFNIDEDSVRTIFNAYSDALTIAGKNANPEEFIQAFMDGASSFDMDTDTLLSIAGQVVNYALEDVSKEDIDKAVKKSANGMGLRADEFNNVYTASINGIFALIDAIKESGYDVETALDLIGITSKKDIDLQNELTKAVAQNVKTTKDRVASLYETFEKINSGDFTPDELIDFLSEEDNAKFLKSIDNLGDAINDEIKTQLDEAKKLIGDSSPELVDALEKSAEKIKLSSHLDKLNEDIDKLQESLKTLSSAFEEYNESGYITLDTFQSLMAENGEYIKMLTIENGQLKINEDAYKAQIAVKLNDYKTILDQAAATEIQALAEAKANGETEESIGLLNAETIALGVNTKAQIARAKEVGVSDAEINAIINKYDNLWNTVSDSYMNNFKEFSGATTSSASDAADKLKEELDNYIAYQDALLDAGKISYDEYTKNVRGKLDNLYSSGKLTAKDYFDYVQKLLEKQLSIYDEVLSAVARRYDKEIESIDKQIDAINEENDALNKQKDEYDKILSVVQEVYDKEIESLQDQQQAIQDKIDALQKANDEEDRALALANARYALEKAQQQRTRLVYNGAEGFVYKTDPEAIRDAKKELKDAELENTVAALEDEKEALDKTIETLEEYKEKWSDISEVYDKEVNRQLAIALWGENYEQMILQNREQDIQDFTNKYVDLQKKVDDNTSLIESFEEKKKYYEELKAQWQEITDIYKNSIEDQHTAMVLGADWENEILSGRTTALEKFKNEYIAIQEQIKQAAIDSANAQAAADKGGSGGGNSFSMNNSSFGSKSKKTYYVIDKDGNMLDENGNVVDSKNYNTKYYNTREEAELSAKTIASRNPRVIGKVFEADINGFKIYRKKDNGDVVAYGGNKTFDSYDDALKALNDPNSEYKKKLDDGWKFVIQAFAKGGVINANNNNPLNGIASKLGEDTAVLARHGERILTPIQNKYWEKWTNALPNLTKNIDALKFNIPNFGSIIGAIANKETTVKQEISISLPNVTNTSGAEYVLNALKTLPLEAVQRVNRR